MADPTDHSQHVEPAAADLLALAEAAARAAGRLVHERRQATATIEVAATKTSPTDVVTESDLAAERLIRERLLAARPADAILGEEGGGTSGSSGITWVIDPIDGTVNYLYGLPAYAVSIAAQAGVDVVAGAVYNPATDEMWTATRGGGAFLNGRPARVSGCTELSRALVATGFGYESARRRQQAEIVARLLPEIRDIRRIGSAALDLCSVASGRVDAYYENGLQPWDLAAGRLIAEEAGARVTVRRDAADAVDLVIAASPAVAPGLECFLVSGPA